MAQCLDVGYEAARRVRKTDQFTWMALLKSLQTKLHTAGMLVAEIWRFMRAAVSAGWSRLLGSEKTGRREEEDEGAVAKVSGRLSIARWLRRVRETDQD